MLDGGLFAPIMHFVVSTPLLIQPKALYIFDSFQACRRTNLALSTALAVRNRIESTKEESHDVDIAWKRTKTYGTNALNDICCIDSLYKRHVPCSYKCPKRAAEPLVLPRTFPESKHTRIYNATSAISLRRTAISALRAASATRQNSFGSDFGEIESST